jgi:hypothetical protein
MLLRPDAFGLLPMLQPRRSPQNTWLAIVLLVACVGASWAAGARHAGVPPASAATPASSQEWKDLTPRQQSALRPLAPHWNSLDDAGRDKWVTVADRYWNLPATEQQLVQARMTQWAKLPPSERGEARLRFQQTRELSAAERQQKWAAYQALSDEQKRGLARAAQRQAKPVILPDNVAGPREAQQAFASKRANAASSMSRKSNVVPNTAGGAGPTPVAVAPTLVKAGTGATTSLVNQRPTPPSYQQSGLPKITATKGFVDPVTLLPKKGAQGAAMASLPGAASATDTKSR